MGHAETVPIADLENSQHEVFYLPMHAVRKESSSTTKIRAVFDASGKSSSGVSLNDTLLVGPTVHSSLIDVLLSFGCIALHSLRMSAKCIVQWYSLRLIGTCTGLSGGVILTTNWETIV